MFGITTTLRADPFREPQDYETPTLGSVMGAKPYFGGAAESTGIKQDFPKTVPTPDNRYSDYASPMADGRIITDYRPNCVSRAPYGHQNATKEWLVKNSEEVTRVSRMRQAEVSGAVYGARYMGPKPAEVQKCSAYGCTIVPVSEWGQGRERLNAAAAPAEAYHGSFDPTSVFQAPAGPKHIGLTRVSEGGVNSRGSAGTRTPIDDPYRTHIL
jgi:hypothetical protein